MLEYNGILSDWETFASGQAIYKAYDKFGKDIHNKRTWFDIADRMSRGFLALIPFLQPDVIIIGGSMGTHFAQYETVLVALIDEKLPRHFARPKFVAATHPERAVIYGCYQYAKKSSHTS